MKLWTFNRKDFFYQHAANFVTIIGFIFSGFAIFLLWLSPEQNKQLILWCSVITALTDNLDGRIAKKLKVASQLGSDLDKGRDKFFICSVFVWLIKEAVMDIWQKSSPLMIFVLFMLALCLFIELSLIVMWIRCRLKKIDASAYLSGKIKMALYFIAAIWWLFCWAYDGFITLKYHYLFFGLLLSVAWVFAYYSLQTYYQRYDQAIKKIKYH